MAKERYESLSKFLSLILRHQPEAVGITLDYEGGWADTEELIAGIRRTGREIDREILEEIVRTDRKGRYAFSPDGKKIHACQGHSVPVNMGFTPIEPPEFLYHGTVSRFLDSILKEGLRPMERQYVHLSADTATAETVGNRRKGETVVLKIRAGDLNRDGYLFYLADNGVWLTKNVPPAYIVSAED